MKHLANPRRRGLDHRTEEQLRVMLMKLEATNAELAAPLAHQLEQKALPPAPEPVKKIRWGQLQE